MARNGSGTYSVPNTFVAGNTITASSHNANWTDIGSEMTNSLALDGQSTMTGVVKGANGTAAAPSYTFGTDTNTGVYRVNADDLGITVGGTKVADFASATTTFSSTATAVSGTLAVTGASTLTGATNVVGDFSVATSKFTVASASGNTVAAGTLQVTGATTLTGVLTQSAVTHELLATGTTGQRSGTTAGQFRYNSTLGAVEWYNGITSSWAQSQINTATVQTFTTGTAATYNTPTGATRLRVRMIGGGGGGGAAATNAGSNGTDSSFGTWTAVHGNGGGNGGSGAGGAGGTGGTDGTGTKIVRLDGAAGGPGSATAGVVAGYGADSFFGGSGKPGGTTAAGGAAKANTGAGGASGANAGSSGGGGGAGEYVEFYISPPAASYTYTVGALGAGGSAGTQAGGNGAAGIIIVEEFY